MNRETEVNETSKQSDTEEVVSAFARVGAVWARYGIGVAQLSVETSARALDATAHALGVLRGHFDELSRSRGDEKGDVIDTSAQARD